LAREANDYAAKMVSDHPGRFGRYAILPLPDVDGTLKEIEYIYDTLKAEGVGAMSSYYFKGKDVWLGDPMFNPVWEELNRRKAVFFTHPTVPKCCEGANGGDLVPGFGNNILEYAADTSRVIGSILVNQIPTRFPNIRFQFSHSGGALPMLIARYNARGWVPQIQQFYYDSAQTSNSAAMSALKIVVGDSQILLGTDFPYNPSIWPGKDRTIGPMVAHVKGLDECGIFSAQELRAVGRENGLRLLPSLAS
jgi:predicted TIM-barrel fold metal-dependent hydrolase